MLTELENDLDYCYDEVDISEVDSLIKLGYDVEVSSPNGYINVLEYVEKGNKKVYEIICNNKTVVASYDHLFETQTGWIFTKDLNEELHKILCDDLKYHSFKKIELLEELEVVDLAVDHDDHKYYTNGLVSHNTNVGKTLIQCSLASNILLQNKNVLYITMEEQEDILSKRFQGNLFDMEIDSIKFLTKEKFKEVYDKVVKQFKSNIKIVGWTSGCKNANHLRLLLKELELKQGFKPDVIFVDYIGCMIPIRLGKTYDSNAELMNITDEVRSIGVEFGIPMVSGLQLNRGGIDSSDVGLGDTAASIGSTFKADFIFGVTQPPDLQSESMYAIKVLKSRSSDKTKLTKGFVGVEPAKMRIYDVSKETDQEKKEDRVTETVKVINKVSNRSKNVRRNKILEE